MAAQPSGVSTTPPSLVSSASVRCRKSCSLVSALLGQVVKTQNVVLKEASGAPGDVAVCTCTYTCVCVCDLCVLILSSRRGGLKYSVDTVWAAVQRE